MTLVSILTCWAFATSEWRTVALYQDDKGYGVVNDYLTTEDYGERIAFIKADGENICVLHVKE